MERDEVAFFVVALASALAAACSHDGAEGGRSGNRGEALYGTVHDVSENAFSHPLPGMGDTGQLDVGAHLFRRVWVSAPASTTASDGLGPTFNARACATCHQRLGRAPSPVAGQTTQAGLILRLSVPGVTETGHPSPDARYGDQLNDRAVLGVPAEGLLSVRTESIFGAFDDGVPYELVQPTYVVTALAFGPFETSTMTSPRLAPALTGVGLLAAIPEEALQAHVDETDADGDGVSGRPNHVWDVREERRTLGHFGWKASQPTLTQQVAAAFHADLGLTSSLFPRNNCPEIQTACVSSPAGGTPEAPELGDDRVDALVQYLASLAVPAQRDVDDEHVRDGERIFTRIGCASCHVPRFELGRDPNAPAHVIAPYTDLLLHDMGDGLADGRPDFEATGGEWRTPPLWGLGLHARVSGSTALLHDGRARGVEEAILWHGGEGARARDAFRHLTSDERASLRRFLEAL